MNARAAQPTRTWALRAIGLFLAAFSVVAPAIPGPLLSQPPIPFAVLWAAYAWANQATPGWGAPLALAGFGFAHDVMAGGPMGLFVFLYVGGFLAARVATGLMSSPNLLSLWGGFIASTAVIIILSFVTARLVLGADFSIGPLAMTAAITAALYPLMRPLYDVGEDRSRT